MSFYAILTPGATSTPVTATPATLTMDVTSTTLGRVSYRLIANTDAWVAQGTSPTAAANTAGSAFVPAGTEVQLDPALGTHVSIVRDSADGTAGLYPVLGTR